MSKPKIFGMKSSYIPNARADMRFNKKLYQRGREYTDKHEAVVQKIRERGDNSVRHLEKAGYERAGNV
jgi:hypothetical protein